MKFGKILLFCCLSIALCACGGHKDGSKIAGNIVSTAEEITIVKHDGYTTVEVKNPWKTGGLLQTYVLVSREKPLPKNLPEGTVVKVPLQKVLVYSSVHASVIKELGEFSTIKGVCDAQYFNMPEVSAGLKLGKIVDAGNSLQPTMEKIVSMAPDAIILSPFQNAGYGTLTNLGIPIIESADYMESTPLGRAEWVKFFGLLYGKEAEADSIFKSVESRYNALKTEASKVKRRPTVLSEMVLSGVWNVPGGNSYMAHCFADAGAAYPWAGDKSTGSLSLDFSQVLDKAQNADFWIIKSFNIKTYKNLASQYPLNSQFVAFKHKQVYCCNTVGTTLFEDFPFHPDVLLHEFIVIFHPELDNGYKLKYFQPLADE